MTKKTEEQLKPCPFCGTEYLDTLNPYGWFRLGDSYFIRCGNPDCFAEIECETPEEVIRRWNRRSAHEAAKSEGVSDEQVKALADLIRRSYHRGQRTFEQIAREALEAAAPHVQQTEVQARDAARWRAVRDPKDAMHGDPYVMQVGQYGMPEPVLLDEADRVADAAIDKQKGETT